MCGILEDTLISLKGPGRVSCRVKGAAGVATVGAFAPWFSGQVGIGSG